MMVKTARLLDDVTQAYDSYAFNSVYRLTYDFINDVSAVYMDVIKDRLYSEAQDSPRRRAAQTVLMNVIEVLVRILAPILSFTTDEVWENYPAAALACASRPESVQLAGWPTRESFVPQLPANAQEEADVFEKLFDVRDAVTKELENARTGKVINKSQEAAITINAPKELFDVLQSFEPAVLTELFIVSSVSCVLADELSVRVDVASGDKCPRCWNVTTLGGNAAYPHVCKRCGDVLEALGYVDE